MRKDVWDESVASFKSALTSRTKDVWEESTRSFLGDGRVVGSATAEFQGNPFDRVSGQISSDRLINPLEKYLQPLHTTEVPSVGIPGSEGYDTFKDPFKPFQSDSNYNPGVEYNLSDFVRRFEERYGRPLTDEERGLGSAYIASHIEVPLIDNYGGYDWKAKSRIEPWMPGELISHGIVPQGTVDQALDIFSNPSLVSNAKQELDEWSLRTKQEPSVPGLRAPTEEEKVQGRRTTLAERFKMGVLPAMGVGDTAQLIRDEVQHDLGALARDTSIPGLVVRAFGRDPKDVPWLNWSGGFVGAMNPATWVLDFPAALEYSGDTSKPAYDRVMAGITALSFIPGVFAPIEGSVGRGIDAVKRAFRNGQTVDEIFRFATEARVSPEEARDFIVGFNKALDEVSPTDIDRALRQTATSLSHEPRAVNQGRQGYGTVPPNGNDFEPSVRQAEPDFPSLPSHEFSTIGDEFSTIGDDFSPIVPERFSDEAEPSLPKLSLNNRKAQRTIIADADTGEIVDRVATSAKEAEQNLKKLGLLKGAEDDLRAIEDKLKRGEKTGGPTPIDGKDSLYNAYREHFGLDDEQADAASLVADAMAETWAKRMAPKTGKSVYDLKKEWYQTRFKDVRSGGDVEGSLLQEQGPLRKGYNGENNERFDGRGTESGGLAGSGEQGTLGVSPGPEAGHGRTEVGRRNQVGKLSFLDPGSHEDFRSALIKAQEANPHGASVSVYDLEDYLDSKVFLTPDRLAGYAVKPDGDIISVFKHPEAPYSGLGQAAVWDAVRHGGNKLDAFDTVLPHLYSKSGFKAVARLAFNDEYAPKGWDYGRFTDYNDGRPDVVFMVFDPNSQPYKIGDGVVVESYEEGQKLQKAALRELRRKPGKPSGSQLSLFPDQPTLFQGAKGSVEFLESGQAIVRALENPDVSTALHELGHIGRRELYKDGLLGDDELRSIEKWAGVKEGVWSVDSEERFARAWENYLSRGQAPTRTLRKVFSRIKEWLTSIYDGIKGSEIDVRLSKDVKNAFDRLLGKEADEELNVRQQKRLSELDPDDPRLDPLSDEFSDDLARNVQESFGVEDDISAISDVRSPREIVEDNKPLFQSGGMDDFDDHLDDMARVIEGQWDRFKGDPDAIRQAIRAQFKELNGHQVRRVMARASERLLYPEVKAAFDSGARGKAIAETLKADHPDLKDTAVRTLVRRAMEEYHLDPMPKVAVSNETFLMLKDLIIKDWPTSHGLTKEWEDSLTGLPIDTLRSTLRDSKLRPDAEVKLDQVSIDREYVDGYLRNLKDQKSLPEKVTPEQIDDYANIAAIFYDRLGNRRDVANAVKNSFRLGPREVTRVMKRAEERLAYDRVNELWEQGYDPRSIQQAVSQEFNVPESRFPYILGKARESVGEPLMARGDGKPYMRGGVTVPHDLLPDKLIFPQPKFRNRLEAWKARRTGTYIQDYKDGLTFVHDNGKLRDPKDYKPEELERMPRATTVNINPILSPLGRRFIDFWDEPRLVELISKSQSPEARREIYKWVVTDREDAVTAMTRRRADYRRELKEVTSGITDTGSRRLLMKYAERSLVNEDDPILHAMGRDEANLQALQQLSPDKWQRIDRAAVWFRKQYDDLLQEVNAVRTRHGYEAIPARQDYFTHIKEEGSLWARLSGREGNTPSSEFSRRNAPYNPFENRREGTRTREDAIRNFEAYLEPTLNQIYLTEHVVRRRALAEAVLDQRFLDAGIEVSRYLHKTADVLAGKGISYIPNSPATGELESWYRMGLRVLTGVTGKSRIIGNLRSAVMQTSGIPNLFHVADYGDFVSGVWRSMLDHGEDAAWRKSGFLTRRYADTRSIVPTKFQKFETNLAAPMELIERGTTTLIWNSLYQKGLKKFSNDAEKALAYADKYAQRVVSGRAVGEKPPVYESLEGKALFQFSLEVNNFRKLMKHDFMLNADGSKASLRVRTARAAQVVTALWAMNLIYDKVFGSKPLPDPIDLAGDVAKIAGSDDDLGKKVALSLGRTAGEWANTVPGAGTLAAFVPDRIAGMSRAELFGKTDIGQFGGQGPPVVGSVVNTGKDLTDMFVNPQNLGQDLLSALSNYFPGGSQAKKTITGLGVANQGYKADSDGDRQYSVQDPVEKVRAVLFGPSSTQAAQEYYDREPGTGRSGSARRTEGSRSTRSRRSSRSRRR